MGKLKLKQLLVVLTIYLIVVVVLLSWIGNQLEESQIGWAFPWIARAVQGALLCYLGLATWFAYLMYRRGKRASARFKVNGPFRSYGHPVAEFQHVFHHRENIMAEMVSLMGERMSVNLGFPALEPKEIMDADKELKNPDARLFHIAQGKQNQRGARLSLVLHTEACEGTQSVKWWILMSGYVDKNRLLLYLALAPLTTPFRIVPFLKGDFNPLDKLEGHYSSTYNSLDIVTAARFLQETVFGALIDCLEKHGIDTSTLKQQRANVMNITVSGGQPSFGAVVQGAMNKVAAPAQQGT